MRPAALLLGAGAVAGPWALGGPGAGWALACGVAAVVLLLVIVERLYAALREAERVARAAREDASQHDAEWREFCAAQDARREETVRHLAEVRLPAALAGESVPAAQPSEAHEGVARLHEQIVAAGAESLRKVREREESLRLVVVALARRVQSSSHRIQEEMAGMEARHAGDPGVLESAMRGDHAAAQQARIAQSLAVLCGEWPGQQWQKPHALVDVVRAGASRIVSYQRVKVAGDQDIAAAATIVEPLVHVVAELLANATQCAPPTTHVEVTVRPVTRGAVIEIDDAGLGMDEYALEQTREIVSGRRLLGFADLGEVPQTGLAVVGRYAERHDLKIDLLPSPYGGVRAVVLVPGAVLETLEPAVVPGSRRPEPGPAATTAPSAATSPAAAPGGERPASVPRPQAGATGLPQRRSSRGRRAGDGPERRHAAPESPAPPPPPSPEEAGAWMGALFAGSRAGSDAEPPAGPVAEPEDGDEPGDGRYGGEPGGTAYGRRTDGPEHGPSAGPARPLPAPGGPAPADPAPHAPRAQDHGAAPGSPDHSEGQM